MPASNPTSRRPIARIARPGSGRDWTIVQTFSAGRSPPGGRTWASVAGLHVGEGLFVDDRIMGEIAAAARDHAEIPAESSLIEQSRDAIEIGTCRRRKESRAFARKQLLALARRPRSRRGNREMHRPRRVVLRMPSKPSTPRSDRPCRGLRGRPPGQPRRCGRRCARRRCRSRAARPRRAADRCPPAPRASLRTPSRLSTRQKSSSSADRSSSPKR